jgi:protein Mpv17
MRADIARPPRPAPPRPACRLASFGAAVHGPVGHYFYGFLDSNFPGTAAKTVALKVFIDQVMWAPIFTIIFFSWSELTQGHGIAKVLDKIKKDLVTGVTASWKVWPVVHLINFRFIPPSQRLLYINSIQIGYNVFLSLLANKVGLGADNAG